MDPLCCVVTHGSRQTDRLPSLNLLPNGFFRIVSANTSVCRAAAIAEYTSWLTSLCECPWLGSWRRARHWAYKEISVVSAALPHQDLLLCLFCLHVNQSNESSRASLFYAVDHQYILAGEGGSFQYHQIPCPDQNAIHDEQCSGEGGAT